MFEEKLFKDFYNLKITFFRLQKAFEFIAGMGFPWEMRLELRWGHFTPVAGSFQHSRSEGAQS